MTPGLYANFTLDGCNTLYYNQGISTRGANEIKDTCGICGQWKGLHEANTLHCPVDGTESGLFTETTYQDSEGMEATIAAQAKRIAALEAALKSARDVIVDQQGEWASVSLAYCPESIAPLREAEEDIDEVLKGE